MATKTRTTIGQNPLDAVVPDLRALQNPPRVGEAEITSGESSSGVESGRKERLTIHLSSGLIERLKNAVFWTPGLTLASLSENALTHVVDELEAERGAAFETRTGELKGGRPLKQP